MALIIPDIILLDTLKKVLKFIRSDWNDNVDKTKTFFHLLLKGDVLQRYDFYKQAQAVFLASDDDTRKLDVHLMFNMNKLGPPAIHITMPGESTAGNGLGLDEGYFDPQFQDDDPSISISTSGTDAFRRAYKRRSKATYNLVITSENKDEVVLIYHFLKSMAISLVTHLNLSGIENIKFSGRDLNINSEQVPQHIFTKSLGLDFEYDTEAYDIFKEIMLTKAIVDGVINKEQTNSIS